MRCHHRSLPGSGGAASTSTLALPSISSAMLPNAIRLTSGATLVSTTSRSAPPSETALAIAPRCSPFDQQGRRGDTDVVLLQEIAEVPHGPRPVQRPHSPAGGNRPFPRRTSRTARSGRRHEPACPLRRPACPAPARNVPPAPMRLTCPRPASHAARAPLACHAPSARGATPASRAGRGQWQQAGCAVSGWAFRSFRDRLP